MTIYEAVNNPEVHHNRLITIYINIPLIDGYQILIKGASALDLIESGVLDVIGDADIHSIKNDADNKGIKIVALYRPSAILFSEIAEEILRNKKEIELVTNHKQSKYGIGKETNYGVVTIDRVRQLNRDILLLNTVDKSFSFSGMVINFSHYPTRLEYLFTERY